MSQSSISESDRPDDVSDTVQDVADKVEDAAEAVEASAEDQAEDAGDSTQSGTPTESQDEHHDDDRGGSGFAGMALRFLIMLLVVFGLSLWLVPMVAPHVPASVAKHIMPGKQALDDRLAAMDAKITEQAGVKSEDVAAMRTQIAQLTERLSVAEEAAAAAKTEAAEARSAAQSAAGDGTAAAVPEGAVADMQAAAKEAAEAADIATVAATEAGKVAAAATRDTASLARQMTSFEGRLADISDQLGAMSTALAKTPGEGATPELAAAFSALQARVDGLSDRLGSDDVLSAADAERFATQDDLRSARTALEADVKAGFERLPDPAALVTVTDFDSLRTAMDGKLTDLGTRVTTTEKSAADAVSSATAAAKATEAAITEVRAAIHDASLRSAIAALTSRLQNGLPFAGAIAEIEKLSDAPVPEALSATAEQGVATNQALLASFGAAAQTAIAADIRAGAGDGLLDQAGAQLRSVVAGRPKSEQEGDSTAAILSRVEGKVRAGALTEAQAEAGGLSEAATAAMADWLARLNARVAAETAAAEYIAAAGGQQG